MRHQNARTKLGRTASHRKALLRNLSTELIRHERIHTTETKAKALCSAVSKLITLAKRQDLAARRQALSLIADKAIVGKLFDSLGPRYANRAGGYTRIFKLGPRKGDGAPVAIIELVDREKVDTTPEQPQKKPGLAARLFGSRKAQQGSASS